MESPVRARAPAPSRRAGFRSPQHTDPTSFFNHDCDPNAWPEGFDMIVARRNISVGEEVQRSRRRSCG
jgi:hypothetical protein